MLVEIAVAARDLPQAREGDIVVARIPQRGFGRLEGKDFIWLTIDTSIPLNDLRGDLERESGRPGEPELIERYRYRIDIDSLTARIPAFDPIRVRDPSDDYQVHFRKARDGGYEESPGRAPLTLDPDVKTGR